MTGGDKFVFYGTDNDHGERDLVTDLNFADDAWLVFGHFDSGTFNPDDKNTVAERCRRPGDQRRGSA